VLFEGGLSSFEKDLSESMGGSQGKEAHNHRFERLERRRIRMGRSSLGDFRGVQKRIKTHTHAGECRKNTTFVQIKKTKKGNIYRYEREGQRILKGGGTYWELSLSENPN